MRASTIKDGDLLSQFDKIDESEAQSENATLKHLPINKHDVAANKDKIRGNPPLEHIFGFCKTFKKTKQLGSHLTFKTADLQDNIYITLGDDIIVNFDKIILYVPNFIPDAQTQLMFNDSNGNRFTLSFDSGSTDRKMEDTQLKYQVDIGSAQIIKSPKYLIVIDQTAAKKDYQIKQKTKQFLNNLKDTKYHVDIDGVRYPRDGVSIDYASNDYLEWFYKE